MCSRIYYKVYENVMSVEFKTLDNGITIINDQIDV